jgi:hypothetical protein
MIARKMRMFFMIQVGWLRSNVNKKTVAGSRVQGAGSVACTGKKYLIGATIQREHPYLNVVVCLAFSGPSVPVKINCATELK